ncbi:MAG: hypothetical protein AAF481_03620 [Acidobacteriota bacterium]
MKRLGEVLVERGWVESSELGRALSAQRTLGGRLGTCLLEAAAIDEGRLLEALSTQLAVPSVDPDQLRTISEDTLRLVPEGVSRRLRAIPFRRHGDRIEVAMLDPTDLAGQDEIAFATGRRVEPFVATEARIAEALDRYYRAECPERLSRLLDRLNRSRYLWNQGDDVQHSGLALADHELPDEGAMTAAHWADGVDELFPTLPELAPPDLPGGLATGHGEGLESNLAADLEVLESRTDAASEASIGEVSLPSLDDPELSGDEPVLLEPAVGEATRADLPEPEAVAPPVPTEPVHELESTEAALRAAADRDLIGDLIVRYLVQHLDRVALLGAPRGAFKAWTAGGKGLRERRFESFSLPTSQPSLFKALGEGIAYHAGPLPPMPSHRALVECWDGALPRACVIVPIPVRDRLAAVLYGDLRNGPLENLDAGVFQRLANAAGVGLERCIMLKKQTQLHH